MMVGWDRKSNPIAKYKCFEILQISWKLNIFLTSINMMINVLQILLIISFFKSFCFQKLKNYKIWQRHLWTNTIVIYVIYFFGYQVSKYFLVLYELVHECIMGTGTDNTRGRVRLALYNFVPLLTTLKNICKDTKNILKYIVCY